MHVPGPTSDFRLNVSTSRGLFYFSAEQIVRLEAKGPYTNIFLLRCRPILSATVLKTYAAQLEPHGFIRTHRSHLVNKMHIRALDASGKILMQDSFLAAISRRRKRIVMEALRIGKVI